MEKIAPSDIPESVLDSFRDDAKSKYPGYAVKQLPYTTGRQEQLVEWVAFNHWAHKNDFEYQYLYEYWVDMKEAVGRNIYTTIELYQEYLNSKKCKIN